VVLPILTGLSQLQFMLNGKKIPKIVYTNFDTSCERMRVNGGYGQTAPQAEYIYPCLQKGDYIFLPDGDFFNKMVYDNSGTETTTAFTVPDVANDPSAPVTSTGGEMFSVMSNGHASRAETERANDIAGGTDNSNLDYTNHMYQIKKIWTAPMEAAGSGVKAGEIRFRIEVDKPISYSAGQWDFTIACPLTTHLDYLAPKANDGVHPIFKFDVENSFESSVQRRPCHSCICRDLPGTRASTPPSSRCWTM